MEFSRATGSFQIEAAADTKEEVLPGKVEDRSKNQKLHGKDAMARQIRLMLLLAIGLPLAGCRSTPLPIVHSIHGASSTSAHKRNSPKPSNHVDSETKSETAEDEPDIMLVSDRETAQDAEERKSDSAGPIQLSMQNAIETGLIQNPDLVAQRAAENVSIAALGVAQTYPFNPFVQVQATPYQNNANAGPGVTYHYVLLMQQIQIAHQQEYREQIAGAQLNSVRWNVLQQQLINVAQTERLYFTALYQRGLRDLALTMAKNNQELLIILEHQLDAGAATAADVAIVRLDAQSTRQQLRLAEANYQTALLDLRRHLGIPIETPLELTGLQTTYQIQPATNSMESLSWLKLDQDVSDVDSLVAGRPDVMAALADVNAARSNVSLADANRVPDLQLGPYYQRGADGTYFLGFRGQMDLPVVNSGKPLLRQRDAECHQRTTAWYQLQTRAKLEADAALERYERARGLMAEINSASSSEFPEELQKLEQQFKAGEVDVLRVFQARNSMIQNQRTILDTQNELCQAAANVTATTGLPLESIARTSTHNLPD